MPRVKRGTHRRDYRHKTLRRAKGFFLTKSKLNRAAQEAVEKALRYGYVGRRLKKRNFRSLWIVRINAAARECGLSSGYFTRAFRQTTGVSPHQWLIRKRVERARGLLLGNGLGLADIALVCGFVDQSHFSRVFTKFEGDSPGRWRQRNRKADW